MKLALYIARGCVFLAALAALGLVAGCGREEPEPQPVLHPINKHTLTYATEGSGRIDGPGSQIVSPGGTGRPVTAVPAEGQRFVGWSDGLQTPTRSDRGVTADLSVTARFAPIQYVLTYVAGAHGTIEGVAQQTVNHGGQGTAVNARPAPGYRFEIWSDGVATAERSDARVTSDLAVTASFVPNQHKLIYIAEGKGRISGATSQLVIHGAAGIPVRAEADPYHHFAGWSDGTTSPERTDRNVKADLTVTAKFVIDRYDLTYRAGEHGAVEGATKQNVEHGGDGQRVVATADPGYHFVAWSDGLTSAVRRDGGVTGDLAVTAQFAANRYTLSYQAAEHGHIDGAATQTVEHGGSGTAVTAVAEKGYHFVAWSDGVATARRVDAEIHGDLQANARFAVNTYRIGGRLSGLIPGTRVVLQNNAGDDLALDADGAFSFAAEQLNASAYAVTVAVQPTSPNQICTVEGGSGQVPDRHVDTIEVACVPRTYTIGGTVSGLPAGDRLVLKNNDGDSLTVTANGAFTFATPLDDGSAYQVKIAKLPAKPNWTCELDKGSGSVAGQDIGDVVVDCFPKVVAEAIPGIRKVRLQWNAEDFSDVTFNLCLAQEEIGPAFGDCQKLRGGTAQNKISSPLTVTPLSNDVPYWFQVEARYAGGRRTLSEVVKAIPFGGLNDTGIDWCASGLTNLDIDRGRAAKSASCESLASSFPEQDASSGRDNTARERLLDKAGSGSAGFDFTKLCRSGQAAGAGKCPPNPLPGDGAKNWGCTKDNVTGLVWEVKTENGLQGRGHTYSWYSTDNESNGGMPGLAKGGKCSGSECDTRDYVRALNETGLCGIRDWRVPTRDELLSIVDNSRIKPSADQRFFPNTMADYYWSSSAYAERADSAWQVYFVSGEAYPEEKLKARHLRLVSGSTVTYGLDNP